MKKTKSRSKGSEIAASPRINPRYFRYGHYTLVFLVILLFASIRFRLRDFPLERDEGEYAYAGQLMLQSIPPYQLAYNMKFPGTYAAYAIILAIFGPTPAAVHTGILLVNAAATLLVYLLAKRLFGTVAGCVASASYALLSTSPSVMGLAGHATHFVMLFAVGSLLVLLKAIETKQLQAYFWSGLLGGLAFLMKQPGIFFPLFAGLYLIGNEWRKPIEWRNLSQRVGMFFGGILLPFAATCLILYWAGVFKTFWFWTISYGREYASTLSVGEGIQVFWSAIPRVIGPSFLIWVIAAIGLCAFLWNRESRTHLIFVFGLFLFSFLAVCPGFYFREHYFILLLPALSILAGHAVSSARQSLSNIQGSRGLTMLPIVLFLGTFSYSLFQQRKVLFQLDPLAACREIYGSNPFPEALTIADYLKAHTSPTARIAVLGSEPEIYFYSQRHSATGYIYTYGLMEEQKYALQMQAEMIREIEASHPEYLVYVDVSSSWLARAGSPQLKNFFAWAQKYVGEQYELVGTADILDDHTEYRWDEEAKGYQPRSLFAVQVFRAREARASLPVPPSNL
jgi:hypothetical protein